MYSRFNNPHCSLGTGTGPGPFSSNSTEQVQQIDFADLLGSILVAATEAEPWIAPHLKLPTPGKQQTSGKFCSGNSTSTTNNKFEVKVDVSNFSPEEINVNVVDGSIVVEAKHEEKEDKFGFISRQFFRRFIIPERVVVEEMKCTIPENSNTLLISAPRIVAESTPKEKTIPINFIDQPSFTSNDHKICGTKRF